MKSFAYEFFVNDSIQGKNDFFFAVNNQKMITIGLKKGYSGFSFIRKHVILFTRKRLYNVFLDNAFEIGKHIWVNIICWQSGCMTRTQKCLICIVFIHTKHMISAWLKLFIWSDIISIYLNVWQNRGNFIKTDKKITKSIQENKTEK